MRFPKPVEYLIFSDICEVSKKSRIEGDLPLIELDCISQNTGELIRIYNSNDSLSEKNYFERGDVLFGKLRPYLNKHFLPNFSGMCSSEIWPLIPKKVSSEFLYCFIQSQYFLLEANISSGTKMPRADWKYLSTINVPIFTQENMNRISKIIIKMEQRIITQKKIISNLESQMNSIKNKLFTKEYDSHTTALSSILNEISNKSIINNQFPVISSTVKGLVLQSEYFDKEIASSNNIGYKIIEKGNIILSPQNLWMGNITFNNKFDKGIVSPSYKVFNVDSKYNKEYIYEILTTKKAFYLYKTISEQGASIVRRNLNVEAFMRLSFKFPDINFQNKIMKYFSSFKNKLKNEKKILSLYEKQKQYLLNKMFI